MLFSSACSLRALEVGVLVGVIVAPLREPGVVVGSVSMERWLQSEPAYTTAIFYIVANILQHKVDSQSAVSYIDC